MKWYLTNLLFTQKRISRRKIYFCETSVVLLRATCARDAYAKAIKWANDEAERPGLTEMPLLGVTRLEEILATRLEHGTEITGSVYFRREPWKNRRKLVPQPKRLQAFFSEDNAKVPCGKLITRLRGKAFVNRLKKIID
jgi:hypothetical protein